MSRMRTVAIVTLLAGTALLVPASAASAATKLTATIVCDSETGAITTSVAGPLVQRGAPRPVIVEFQRQDAANVSPDGLTRIAPLETPFKVTVTTKPNGSVSANGYVGSFDPATSLYYQETVTVTLRSPTGLLYGTMQATCKRDLRHTVTLTCDEAAGMVTATVLGRQAQTGGTGAAKNVLYQLITTYQSTPDDVRWTRSTLGWDYDHRVAPAIDGTWSDAGFTKPVTASNYHYYAEKVIVNVVNSIGLVVGSGSAECVLVDRSGTTQR